MRLLRRAASRPRLRAAHPRPLAPRQASSGNGNGSGVHTLEEIERQHFIQVLRKTRGVIEGPNGAARLLDLKPSTARFRIKKLGITARTLRELRTDVPWGGAVTDLAGLQLLRRIEEGVAGKSGEAFFRQIVRDLTLALNAHAAFTSRLLPERRAEMLAFWVDGRYEKCNTYSLAGTPCEFVYNGRITSFARDIGNVFPVDREWFAELGVHSYLGVPIVSETGEVHGHLAVMDKPERDWREADVDILRLFSLRTAVELERAKAHRMLEESNAQLAAAKLAAEKRESGKERLHQSDES